MSDSVKKYYEAIENKWYSNSTAKDIVKDSIVEEVKDIMEPRWVLALGQRTPRGADRCSVIFTKDEKD